MRRHTSKRTTFRSNRPRPEFLPLSMANRTATPENDSIFTSMVIHCSAYLKQEATGNKCIATSNKCLTTSNKKLLETRCDTVSGFPLSLTRPLAGAISAAVRRKGCS